MGLFKERGKKAVIIDRIELLGDQIRKQRQEMSEKGGPSLAEIAALTSAEHSSSGDQGAPQPG